MHHCPSSVKRLQETEGDKSEGVSDGEKDVALEPCPPPTPPPINRSRGGRLLPAGDRKSDYDQVLQCLLVISPDYFLVKAGKFSVFSLIRSGLLAVCFFVLLFFLSFCVFPFSFSILALTVNITSTEFIALSA